MSYKKEKKRIIIFAGGGDIGGGKTHILSLAQKLAEQNIVKVVSFREGEFSRDAIALGIDTQVIPHTKGFIGSAICARAIVNDFSPNIIHCHGTKANVMGVLAKRKNIPLITTIHSDPKLDYMNSFARRVVLGTMNRISHCFMDFYIAVADGMQDTLIERGYDPYKIFKIYNGFVFSKGSSIKEKDDDAVVVGIAARFNAVKDIPTTIKAFALACKENDKLKLKLAGDGEEKSRLEVLCKELEIEDRVEFCGWQSNINSFYQGVDINVLSSISETFPYSLLEGANNYCACIASAVGGIPYMIDDGIDGYLFDPGDVEAFAGYILKLANDEALRGRFAKALHDKVVDKFSLDAMASRQIDIYDSILYRFHNKKAKNALTICSAYGKGNAGDEAVLSAILRRTASIDPNIPCYVMTRRVKDTQLCHKARGIYIFNILKLESILRKSKVFISGGGTLIQDVTSSRSLYFYLYAIKRAKKNGCKVIMYGCGIGPLLKKYDSKQAAKVINKYVDQITLRDKMSLEYLASMGVDKPCVQLSADPVLSLNISSRADFLLKKAGINPDGKYIALALRQWPNFNSIGEVAEFIKYAYKKYGLSPVFYSIEVPKDRIFMEQIAKLIDGVPYHFLNSTRFAEDNISIISKMSVVCGMRLHALVFAAAAETISFAISYDPKVDGFYDELESAAKLSIENLSSKTLEKLLDSVVEENCNYHEKVSHLKKREKINEKVLREAILS